MNKKKLLELYNEMVVVRRLEEASARLYQEGKIGGFLHLYIGQEAVGSGIVAARQPQDRVITAYRDHGIAISCGMDPKVVMAELLGKETGCSKGRGARCTSPMSNSTSGAVTRLLAHTYPSPPGWRWPTSIENQMR